MTWWNFLINGKRKAKEDRPGLQTAVLFEFLAGLGFTTFLDIFQRLRQSAVEHKLENPMLSNLGVINRPGIFFGRDEAVNGYIITPIAFAPTFLLGASAFNNTLTLAAGFNQASIAKDIVEGFLENMADNLARRV